MILHDDNCYRDLEIPFLDHDICIRLQKLAIAALRDNSYEGYEWTHFDHLHFKKVGDAVPEINDWLSTCAVPARPIIYLLPPNITMPVHTDTEYTHVRQSTIAMPLIPEEGIADTHWYESTTSTEPAVTARWSVFSPKLLNIALPHGGIRTGNGWRCSLQISLAAAYEDLVSMISVGKLFDGYRCSIKHGLDLNG